MSAQEETTRRGILAGAAVGMASLAGCSDVAAQLSYDEPRKVLESFFKAEFSDRGLSPLACVYGGGRGRAVSLYVENATKRETAEIAGDVARAYRNADGDEIEYAKEQTPALELVQVAGVTGSFEDGLEGSNSDWYLNVRLEWTDELLAGELSESAYYDRIEATSTWPTEQ